MSQLNDFPPDIKIPNHIALILDGNRRWARAHNLSTHDGHQKGFEVARELAKAARKFGVHTFTVWGFSTENWDRSPKEVYYLMKLFKQFVLEVKDEAKKEKIRFVHLGRKDRLPKDLIECIDQAETETKENSTNVLNAAFDYGGRDEILRTIKKIIEEKIPVQSINEKLVSSFLDTANQPYPYPDFCIRSSGEQRTSGLLPWQMAYAELYWEPEYLPDLTPEKLKEAILDFNRRHRRFGKDDVELHFTFDHRLLAKLEANAWRSLGKSNETRARDYLVLYFKELYGLSKIIALRAAQIMVVGLLAIKNKNWEKVSSGLMEFYRLIKEEAGLPFDPAIVAFLEEEFLKGVDGGQTKISVLTMLEEIARKLYGEIFRVSVFQISKAAHLRVLAVQARDLAYKNSSGKQWVRVENYLGQFYLALKERVA